MNIQQTFTLQNKAGVTQLDYDQTLGGIKDGSNRFFTPWQNFTVDLLAATVDTFIWTCIEGIWQLNGVAEAHTVVGGAAAAVTVVVCPGSVAIASGTAQLTAVLDLTVTAPAKSFGTLIATPTSMFRGDSLGIDMSGTLTGLVGKLTVQLKRIG